MGIVKVIILVAIIGSFLFGILRISVFKKNTYRTPYNKKNLKFLIFSLIILIGLIIIASLLQSIAYSILSIPFIGNLITRALDSIEAGSEYIVSGVLAIIINIAIIIIYSSFKGSFARRIKKLSLKKTEDKKDEPEDGSKKKRLIFKFKHTKKEEDNEDYGDGDKKYRKDEFGDLEEVEKRDFKIKDFILGLFFVGPDYIHTKPWLFKCVKILQLFIYIIEGVYFVVFLTLALTIFFPLPEVVYKLLIDVIKLDEWYIYPFASIILLQELCNVFTSTLSKEKDDEVFEEIAKEDEEIETRLSQLQLKIKQRFDDDHHLRYYPSVVPTEVPKYECTNVAFEYALDFISNHMKQISGHTVQSYLKCLDAMYNDNHVYFCASFYSEFGEYLVAYTYTRLLAGERLIYVIPDSKEREDFKKYIRSRLNKLTKSEEDCTWRVYTSDERLDQADVLIASPEEFKNDNIVINYPVFFEEVCNAIFIDADKIVMADSYLCPIIAMRLQKETNYRIKFTFLTSSVYRGFASGSLPKFFCVDKVLNFSGAKENESVFYNLWNRESNKNRIYNKFGQKLTTPESLLAELALEHNVDGVRILTDAPIEHGDKETLLKHKVEINNLYKEIPDVNFLIYTDNRCNLSAAVYLCARFRGKKKSIVHILSKPYLLREFFMSKMTYEDFINRSSFIQPRVTEHVNNQRLSLLKIYCDATDNDGIEVNEFMSRMRNVISLAIKRSEKILCQRCQKILATVKYTEGNREVYKVEELNIKQLTEYLIAGLCDRGKITEKESYGNRAKDYYIIVEGNRTNGLNVVKNKYIFFKRTREVFDKILERNERVSLILNDVKIGELNTYPTRVKSEYIVGQNITFNNMEYEIESISDDCRSVFLKRENVTFKNILDTIALKRFKISLEGIRDLPAGILYFSKSNLKKIEVRMFRMKENSYGETYGFYNLMSDTQTLDFVKGVLGNPLLGIPIKRDLQGEKVLQLSLESRIECNDGMRLLLSAVFNEFIKTLFPDAYRCISVVPVLEDTFKYDDKHVPSEYEEFVKKLYPYLNDSDNSLQENIVPVQPGANGEEQRLAETDKYKCRFLFINDCEGEDIGVLDWFYDRMGHLMQELLINVNSYLVWLKLRADQKHYIYFGNTELAKSYDLDGCCELLNGLNLVLSDAGSDDFETASDENEDVVERCSFCHKVVESGRFTIFNDNRFICAECFDVVDSKNVVDKLYDEVLKYLSATYPLERFEILSTKLDGQYQLEKGKEFNEYYCNIDLMNKTVGIEQDIPLDNARAALLRATINLWQSNNNLLIPYIDGQLYFEEIKYLRSLGLEVSANWIYENISEDIRRIVDEITEYVKVEEGASKQALTSFDYIREQAKSFKDDSVDLGGDDLGEDGEDVGLFNPAYIPRFWKRYLKLMFDANDESDEDDPTINRDNEELLQDDSEEDIALDEESELENEINEEE